MGHLSDRRDNPIIPVFTRESNNLPEYLAKTIVRDEYLNQYLTNFDPDREILPPARILSEVEMWRIPQRGTGLFEVLTISISEGNLQNCSRLNSIKSIHFFWKVFLEKYRKS